MAERERLDKLLVKRGLTASRERARAMILAGEVLVNDQPVDKSGAQVDKQAVIRLKTTGLPYVSRGGLKLAEALRVFEVCVRDRVVLDVGASTGGFTDCLLQSGAAKVYAVDVGYGQLAWKLRTDARVVNLERTNIRHLTADRLAEPPGLAVIDASFISLEKVLPAVLPLLTDDAELITLVKPQFEVGKGQVGKGGVVRDTALHQAVMDRIKQFAEEQGCRVIASCTSPILGPKGNREFLLHLRKGEGR